MPRSTSPATDAVTTRITTSADGTEIAYEVRGSGPAVVLVDGALCSREMGHARGLAEALADRFTVHAYDRRGRGESGPGATAWSVDREVEDLRAVIDAAGGRAHVFAASSGAALALEAARRAAPIDRLVCYEVPFVVDDSHAPNDPRLPGRMQALVDEGRRGDAVKLFMRTVGVPAPFLLLMPLTPVWKKLVRVAHTLPYDLAMLVDHGQGRPLPDGCYAEVEPATLVLVGGRSPASMRTAQAAVAAAVPRGRLEVLEGQTHMVKPRATAPVVADFLTA